MNKKMLKPIKSIKTANPQSNVNDVKTVKFSVVKRNTEDQIAKITKLANKSNKMIRLYKQQTEALEKQNKDLINQKEDIEKINQINQQEIEALKRDLASHIEKINEAQKLVNTANEIIAREGEIDSKIEIANKEINLIQDMPGILKGFEKSLDAVDKEFEQKLNEIKVNLQMVKSTFEGPKSAEIIKEREISIGVYMTHKELLKDLAIKRHQLEKVIATGQILAPYLKVEQVYNDNFVSRAFKKFFLRTIVLAITLGTLVAFASKADPGMKSKLQEQTIQQINR